MRIVNQSENQLRSELTATCIVVVRGFGWELQYEFGALAHLALEGNCAAEAFGQPLDNRQPEALTFALRRGKRSKQSSLEVFGNAHSCVLHRNDRATRSALRPQGQLSPLRHCLDGIGH